MNAFQRVQDLLWRYLTLKGAGKAHAQLSFKTGLDQVGRQLVAAGERLEDAAKYWLMETELLLDGLRGEPDLPTDVALSRRHTAVDEG